MYRIAGATLLAALAALPASATDALLYLESQMVGGYSSAERRAVFHSMHPEDPMQKPSLGIDFLGRFSGERGDVAALALQARAAINPRNKEDGYLEPQLYNAYVKVKPPFLDIWIGHNRPALGLSSYFDSHGLLLPTLAMEGFGFDRDWGGGLYRQFDFGDLSVSATTGSGMLLYLKGSWLTAARLSYGVLARDNYTVGFSGSYGDALDAMRDDGGRRAPAEFGMGGLDYAHLVDNFEIRADALAGKRNGEFTAAVLVRAGVNLLEEDRLKLEVQPSYWRMGHENNFQAAAGISYLITGYLTARGMYLYDYRDNDHRVIVQMYLYWRPS